MTVTVLPAGGARWPVALVVALGAHLALAGFVALKPQAPPLAAPPPPPPALLLDLAPPAPLPPPPPKPVAQAPTPKPPPVIERAVAKLPPPKPTQKAEAAPEAPSQMVDTVTSAPTTEPVVDTPPVRAQSGPPPDAMAAFQGRLMAHLGRHKRYPMTARQRHQQGTAWVRLTLDRKGRVLSQRLERGCGVDALDREAVELVGRAQPLPEIPDELGEDQMELVLPVEFSLR